MAWVRHHDKYDAGYKVDAQAEYVNPQRRQTPQPVAARIIDRESFWTIRRSVRR